MLSQDAPDGKTPVCQCEGCKLTSLLEAWTPSRLDMQRRSKEE